MSRVFVTGDCHRDITKLIDDKSWFGYVKQELTKDDYVIILGDFGMIWLDKEDEYEKNYLDHLNNQQYTTLIVLGNHENYNAIEKNYPKEDIKLNNITFKGRKIRDSIIVIERGEIFDINNKLFFAFGGAHSIDKNWRILNISWWEREEASKEEYNHAINNLTKYNNNVDYIITHDIPLDVYKYLGYTYSKNGITPQYLHDFYHLATFKYWYAGHHHMDTKLTDKVEVLYDEIKEINF